MKSSNGLAFELVTTPDQSILKIDRLIKKL
jgi:hypothetical protein